MKRFTFFAVIAVFALSMMFACKGGNQEATEPATDSVPMEQPVEEAPVDTMAADTTAPVQ